jgi:aspartyl-tRNA(Asn)/glutamyl-tRNA(Gln) amidotransferase subunit A
MLTPLRLFPDESETIEGVGRALREGRTTCAAVLERCFHQIDLWDERVHAWVFVDRAGAMRQARALDEELKAGNARGPLHGIPIGIKDIIDVAGLPTAAGFRPWRDRVAEKDANRVAALRWAGAVILGKTVTTQFAWIDPPPTRNPWNLERTPGGSSSGSAAAVATGMCLAAMGTQTGGSIIRPASFCGVCGYKPMHGLSFSDGILPFAPTLDHPGPIARTVGDLEVIDRMFNEYAIYQTVTLPDGRAPSEPLPPVAEPPTLYRLRGMFEERAEPSMRRAYDDALLTLQRSGAEIEELHPSLDGVLEAHRVIMASEAAAGHEARLAEHPSEYRPQIRALVEEGLNIPAVEYVRAMDFKQRFARAIRDEGVGVRNLGRIHHAIAVPATLGPAPDASTTGDPAFNSPWSLSGHPVVSIPIALSPEGLPLALQLVAFFPTSSDLIPIAHWCERSLRAAATHPTEV